MSVSVNGSAASPAIVVDHVSKQYRLYHERNNSVKGAVMHGRRARYEEFWALDDVSFEIPPGSTFGLIGENGSGKSTLLKCLAKILRPEKGEIVVNGRVSALLELGAGFHPELSGRENVFLNGAILGMTKREIKGRFDDIVGFAGLEHFIDSPVKNYSSGMYVRLGFAVAITVDPDILLIDEVLAVGDTEFQRRCDEKLDELRSAGKTIVIVSHALDSLRHLCDQMAMLEHGKLLDLGKAPAVIDRYVDKVHLDRLPDGQYGTRNGSGEGRIERIEILDRHTGEPAERVRTGDDVIFRLHYMAHEPIERPIFGFAVNSLDGVRVSGTNTREHEVVPDKIDGPGYVDLHVARLLLTPGTYDVSVSMYNYTVTHPYDSRNRFFRFDVDNGQPPERTGVVSLGGEWKLDEKGGSGARPSD